jgi:hypothetical protein
VRQYQHLLHYRYGVAWEGLRNGRPEQHVLRAQGGTGEDAEGIGATGSGTREPCRWDTPLLQIGDAGQDCGTIGSRYDHTKSSLCHLITSHGHTCVISVTADWRSGAAQDRARYRQRQAKGSGGLLGGTIVNSVPLVIIFNLFFCDYNISGLTAGSVTE